MLPHVLREHACELLEQLTELAVCLRVQVHLVLALNTHIVVCHLRFPFVFDQRGRNLCFKLKPVHFD